MGKKKVDTKTTAPVLEPAPAPAPAHVPLPRLRPRRGSADNKLRPHERAVYPDDAFGELTVYYRNPSIVVRVDGRYGVARLMRGDEAPRTEQEGYVAGLDSSRSTGLVHEPATYRTRAEAEAHAWKLARELGAVGDWP